MDRSAAMCARRENLKPGSHEARKTASSTRTENSANSLLSSSASSEASGSAEEISSPVSRQTMLSPKRAEQANTSVVL